MGLVKRFAVGLIVILAVVFGVSASVADEPERCIDTPCRGLMSAFGAESTKMLKEMTDTKFYNVIGRTAVTGKIGDRDYVLGLSGVSMSNAAMMPQAWFGTFQISEMVFSGIAGGVNPDVNIGDVVVPARWAQYQEFHFCREVDGEFNCTSDLPNYGMMFPRSGVSVCTVSGPVDQCERKRWFEADKEMLRAAKKAARKTQLVQCGLDREGNEVCLDQQPIIKVGGNGVAGPTFVDNELFRKFTWDAFEADTLDMESSAWAHVSYANDIPFIIFRSASDLAGGGPGENQIGTFFRIAADNSASVLLAFLEEWK